MLGNPDWARYTGYVPRVLADSEPAGEPEFAKYTGVEWSEARRISREERLRALGFEDPSEEQRREQLSASVMAMTFSNLSTGPVALTFDEWTEQVRAPLALSIVVGFDGEQIRLDESAPTYGER